MKLVLSELLRPTEFEDLMQPAYIVDALGRMVERSAPMNMLFYGSPGLGKTSAARIIFKKLDAAVTEINGSLHTGIDLARELRPLLSAASLVNEGPRIIFIDEADYLSKNAQAAMRGLIDGARTARFLFTANEINRFHPAIISRCTPICFDISAANADEAIARLSPRIANKIQEVGYQISADRLRELLYFYFPDIRSVLSVIEFEAKRELIPAEN